MRTWTPRLRPGGGPSISPRPATPTSPSTCSRLGNFLFRRSRQAGDGADLDDAISSWQRASQVPVGIPRVRLDAARAWGAAAAGAGRVQEAAEGYAAAVGLLPVVAFHGLGRAVREEHLAQWAGLAADAAACAVLDGRPEAAAELLEQGRSVLWTQALNLRTDLTRLADRPPTWPSASPASARSSTPPCPTRSRSCQRRRHRAGRGRCPAPAQEAADLRRRKAREWDDVVAQVRALDGFGHFLAAVPVPGTGRRRPPAARP